MNGSTTAVLETATEQQRYRGQDNEWNVAKNEYWATIRTVTGRMWCGFTMVKAASFIDDWGTEKAGTCVQ